MAIGAARVRADGGVVRFSGERGGLRITIFTSPTPPRTGTIDVSVLVQEPGGKTLAEMPIRVIAYRADDLEHRVEARATSADAVNKLMQAAQLEIDRPGAWRVEVVIGEESAAPAIQFAVEISEAPPPWLDMIPWIGWPFAVIALFALHQCVSRETRPSRDREGSP